MLAEIAKPPCPRRCRARCATRCSAGCRDTSRSRCRISAMISPCGPLALVERLRLQVEVDVRRRAAAAGRARCRPGSRRLDRGDALDALQVLQHAKRELLGALERRCLRACRCARSTRPCPRSARSRGRPSGSAGRSCRKVTTETPMMTPGVIERPVHLPRVGRVEPVEEAAAPWSCGRRVRRTASGSASSASASA